VRVFIVIYVLIFAFAQLTDIKTARLRYSYLPFALLFCTPFDYRQIITFCDLFDAQLLSRYGQGLIGRYFFAVQDQLGQVMV
jgi:hypothetical protein